MRHLNSGRKLNRDSAHRKAMFRNMSNSLFQNEIIKTTVPKAKELRRVAEPLITLAKEDSVAHRRLAFNRLRDRDVVTKLFNELGPRYDSRRAATCESSNAGFVLETKRLWPMSNWSEGRARMIRSKLNSTEPDQH